MRRRSSPLRRDAALANTNAAIWAVGNGLVSTTLVRYLAMEFGAKGLAIGLILAAPRLVGVLRLGLPALLERLGHRKPLCLVFFFASALVLVAMAPASVNAGSAALVTLTTSWALYHLLEYCGVVLLWSWLGDLMPPRVRGRLIGQRERWLMLGRVGGIGLSFGLYEVWQGAFPSDAKWVPLAYSASVGSAVILLAPLPLAWMRNFENRSSARPRETWRGVVHCLVDPAYRKLLTFSCCFAIANGLTGAAQGLYIWRVLGINYATETIMKAMMHGGQAALAPAAGRWVDARGVKAIMFVAQLIAATGPLFYWMATAEAPWWVVGAWVVWIAYVGLNVGLDQTKLALAPPDNNVPALAAYHAISDLASGVMFVVGGVLVDRLIFKASEAEALQGYATLFFIGWLARTAVAGLILRLRDPGEKTAAA